MSFSYKRFFASIISNVCLDVTITVTVNYKNMKVKSAFDSIRLVTTSASRASFDKISYQVLSSYLFPRLPGSPKRVFSKKNSNYDLTIMGGGGEITKKLGLM